MSIIDLQWFGLLPIPKRESNDGATNLRVFARCGYAAKTVGEIHAAGYWICSRRLAVGCYAAPPRYFVSFST